MVAKTTEELHTQARALDARPPLEVASILAEGQVAAAAAVQRRVDRRSRRRRGLMAECHPPWRRRCVYVAAGSSGLMALADAQELGGHLRRSPRIKSAFTWPAACRRADMPGDTEDDTDGPDDRRWQTCRAARCGDRVSAPAARRPITRSPSPTRRARGARIIAIANNPGAPLLALADHRDPACRRRPRSCPARPGWARARRRKPRST